MAQRLTIYIPVPRLVPELAQRTQSPFTTVVISAPIRFDSGRTGSRSLNRRRRRASHQRGIYRQTGCRGHRLSGQGGSGYEPTGDSQPIRAPVVIVPPLVAPPRPVTPPNAPPVIPPVAATPPVGGRVGSQVQAPNSIVAGAPPRMREPAPTPATGAVPVDIRATRVGYQQYLRTAKASDIAVVALPGLAGLMQRRRAEPSSATGRPCCGTVAQHVSWPN
jgi:hypothetical protein